MTTLTTEYFDKVIKEQTKEFKAYSDKNQADMARMVSSGFESVMKQLDVREKVEKLRGEMAQVRSALNL